MPDINKTLVNIEQTAVGFSESTFIFTNNNHQTIDFIGFLQLYKLCITLSAPHSRPIQGVL
jgi:hypothetical protein